jgi:hypothetical protein
MSEKLPAEQKAVIGAFYAVASSDDGKAWVAAFFSEVRK